MKLKTLLGAAAVLTAFSTSPTLGDTGLGQEKGTLSFVFENDLFYKTDRDYTNGVELSYTSPTQDTPELIDQIARGLPFFSSEGKVRASYAVGQSIFTPSDTRSVIPPPTQRPYAGFLYGSVGITDDTGSRLDQLSLQIGLTGPSSLASDTQRFVHRVINDPEPMGWHSQLRGEPGVVLIYSRNVSIMPRQSLAGLNFDLEPHYGAAVGNIYDYVNAGAMARLGFNIPDDYGPLRIEPSLPGSGFFQSTGMVGAYIFAGADGRAIGRNFFLDGNTSGGGPSVQKKTFVGDFELGAALTFNFMQVTFTHVIRTKEYRTQPRPDQFGAINVSFKL